MSKLIILLTLAVAFANLAFADVTRKHKSSARIFGANEGTSIDYFTADKMTSESKTKWTRGMMKTMTGGKEVASGSIIRLDKQLMWQVDPKEKQYSEMTFAEFKELMKKSGQEMEKGDSEAPADTATEDLYEWKVETLSDPNSKMINSWNCKNMKIVATGTNKQDSLDRVIITFDSWNSTEIPGTDEMLAFYQKYATALGIDQMLAQPGASAAIMQYEKQFKALAEEAKKAPGEAVSSLVEIKRHQLAQPNIGKAMKEGMKNEMIGKLPFGKKKEPKQEEPRYEDRVKFSVQTELLESIVAPVDAAKFEVPAGFKLKKK